MCAAEVYCMWLAPHPNCRAARINGPCKFASGNEMRSRTSSRVSRLEQQSGSHRLVLQAQSHYL
ncbi:unnamed protein product [Fusarium graminearum]|uniref:Chromosome 2, complete genome n=1 Tax=Gibberella zeae (strain ATCC MYA-4620 / CBS 123657 / FGSC 9075 / NRRL 31084 / PH-1) TaxID=229533 RepID=A0A098DDQ3_GIBZE|nr:unnamed protein product [Fusarium graminearum]CZS80369.1 unnamed protein product [Fusarium graminearum]